ncbi:hypothetical protein NLU13_9886 [Sarocladium strictum]|uniref:Impact N-terminal domain-containing protein n=1 Tax=Sarocladium strictum TaxID=5046 RepID=A0AA39G945_SARSR|nr:hypothetical protein NLU13_9886 [Sarocladium strictum]
MADQGDLKELLRMLTARKVSMLAAMKHVKSLQAASLKSIADIAEAPLSKIESALGDQKLAKGFHTACKSHGKKRPAGDDDSSNSASSSKKQRLEPHKRDLDYASMSSDDLEAALELPLVEDEAVIRATKLITNRAPVVLAFAVELLRFTMPEQPLSSRLSLAQAVVSANSRTKALSIGIEKAPPGGEELIPDGQPTVRVLGREVPVLKRGGYTWSGSSSQSQGQSQASTATLESTPPAKKTWSASRRITSRDSTFIAHAATITSPSARAGLIKTLMTEKPELESASHNAWAVRTSFGNSPLKQEASFDDGETGCGNLMLQVMREADITNTVVVLTRWFGGTMLGPDRWRLMREAVNDALSSQRRTPTFSGEALWGLDPQDKTPTISTIGMAIHRPEGARNYLLRSFAGRSDSGEAHASPKKTTTAALNDEKQENLGRLLGALRLLFASWAEVLDKKELDRRAWGWYVSVRPDVEGGPAGWGAKGELDLGKILDLRR